jgi:hypothetical protein
MDVMIGYCGYNCHLCAARSNDPAVRQKLVDGKHLAASNFWPVEHIPPSGAPKTGFLTYPLNTHFDNIGG